MAETPYEQAIARKAQISARMDELKTEQMALAKELSDLSVFIGMWHRLSGTQPEHNSHDQPTRTRSTRPKNPPREDVGDLVEKILRRAGTPIPRAKLYEAVLAWGMTIYGKDPEMVFSTMLWRMRDRFIRLRDHGYWLINEPCSRVGYDPSAKDLLS